MGMEQNLESLKQNKRSWNYDVKLPGFRYHLSNIHAALGSVQIKRLPEIAAKRKALAATFRTQTAHLAPHLDYLHLDPGFVPFMNCATIRKGRRDSLRAFLEEKGVQTGIHWTPGHHFTLFKDCAADRLEGTERFYDTIISLPFYTGMTEAECSCVTGLLNDFFHA